MDLSPSTFRSRSDSNQNEQRNAVASQNRKGLRARSTGVPAGAIRRSSEPVKAGGKHSGKLTAAAVIVAGAVFWTTSSSKSFAPTQTEAPETPVAAATVVAPEFFFDDRTDALERIQVQDTSDYTLGNTLGSILDSDNSDPSQSMHIEDDADVLALADTAQNTPPEQSTETVTSVLDDAVSTYSSDIPPALVMGKAAATNSFKPDALVDDIAPDASELKTSMPSSQQITVVPGDTLSGILYRNGLNADEMRKLMTNEEVKQHLSNIDVGQVLELTQYSNGDFMSLTTRAGDDTRVNILSTSEGFNIKVVDLPIERKRTVSSGRIDQSLYIAAEEANLKQSTIMELANIFQWELDFARDIREGDKFSLVYDRLYREGEYIGDGDILAAEFMRGGKTYQAIRFTTDDGKTGYYSPNGKSKRRTFMRHPVDVVRITSKFNPNRLHPVLHQLRAHRGVDYGSPHGSPIYATADGRVIFSGEKSAYGNTVILKHGEKFSTLYAHMSKISSKSKVGERVNQGDVIGYVGNTGRVTGTHLHYEFRVNDKQIDPLIVELPAAAPLEEQYLSRLQALADEMDQLMDGSMDEIEEQVATAGMDNDSQVVE